MQVVIYSSLGLELPIRVPATIDELLSMMKGNEALLVKTTVDHEVFHGTLGDIRSDVADALAALTGIERKTKEVGKKKDGTASLAYAESEQDFVERVEAITGSKRADLLARPISDLPAASIERFTKLGIDPAVSIKDAIVAANPYDPTPRERKPKAPRAPTKGDTSLANAVVASGKAAEVAAALAETLGHEVEPTVESLAAAIMEDRIAEQARLEADRKAKFGL